jgi:hypothetical protein
VEVLERKLVEASGFLFCKQSWSILKSSKKFLKEELGEVGIYPQLEADC